MNWLVLCGFGNAGIEEIKGRMKLRGRRESFTVVAQEPSKPAASESAIAQGQEGEEAKQKKILATFVNIVQDATPASGTPYGY